MPDEPKQMPKTNCPRCGTTQVYAVDDRVICLCCHAHWTNEEFIQEARRKEIKRKVAK